VNLLDELLSDAGFDLEEGDSKQIDSITSVTDAGATGDLTITAGSVVFEGARAQISGRTVGMLKLLFHRETLEILGIHCFGSQASEIIHIGQAIMAQKGAANSLMYFINTTFNYPTMAEAYRVAALNGLNRVEWSLPGQDIVEEKRRNGTTSAAVDENEPDAGAASKEAETAARAQAKEPPEQQ